MLFVASVSIGASAVTPFIVVLDAGHGGHDSGAVGRKANEKTLVLDITRRLGKLLEAHPNEIKVVYTRNNDTFIPLQKRADIANAAHGNLFVSLHINDVKATSPGRSTVTGISVYTLGPEKSDRNMQVAMRENSVMELENDFQTKYSGFDPKSAESYIFFEMKSSMHQRQSVNFARMAHQNLLKATGRPNKGMHQAGFWVLWAPNMPSVLVELDFICNPRAEDFLCSETGKQQCAQALYQSILNWARTQKNNT